MNAIILSTQPMYSVSNSELWQQVYSTPSFEWQEFLLLLILERAKDNDERWEVFSHSNASSTKEEALFAMIPHATTPNELRRIATHATNDMLEVYEELANKSLAIQRTQLRLARTNHQRWQLCRNMAIEILRDETLSEILAHSTSNGERWWVFFNTKSRDLKARALKEIMTIRRTKRT
jgi:hypothetical protein